MSSLSIFFFFFVSLKMWCCPLPSFPVWLILHKLLLHIFLSLAVIICIYLKLYVEFCAYQYDLPVSLNLSYCVNWLLGFDFWAAWLSIFMFMCLKWSAWIVRSFCVYYHGFYISSYVFITYIEWLWSLWKCGVILSDLWFSITKPISKSFVNLYILRFSPWNFERFFSI